MLLDAFKERVTKRLLPRKYCNYMDGIIDTDTWEGLPDRLNRRLEALVMKELAPLNWL